MAIKVIAQLRDVKLGKNPGKKFVMRPDPGRPKVTLSPCLVLARCASVFARRLWRSWRT